MIKGYREKWDLKKKNNNNMFTHMFAHFSLDHHKGWEFGLGKRELFESYFS